MEGDHSLPVGCALRRQELASLKIEDIQLREGRWVIIDLRGKGGRIRTVAVPIWVKHGIDAWIAAAMIEKGRLLRPVSKSGKMVGDELGDWAIWSVVQQSSKQIGIEHFGAHDLRRTCANVWSAALSQAKSDLTVWSAQMYSTFGGVYDSWPGWNALRPLPI
jgi:integrase